MIPSQAFKILLLYHVYSLSAWPLQSVSPTEHDKKYARSAESAIDSFALPFGQVTTSQTSSPHSPEKRQPGPGRSTRCYSVFYFSCPRLGGDLRETFSWKVNYDEMNGHIFFSIGDNVDYINTDFNTGWNPVEYKASWHHRVCVPHSRELDCYYHFWQHFYGEGYPTRTVVVAPTSALERGGEMRPGVEETCVPHGTSPSAHAPTSSCDIVHIETTMAAGPMSQES